MKKIVLIGGSSLLLLMALCLGAFFAGPMLASAHGPSTSTKAATTATTQEKTPDHPLREFTRDYKDALIDQIAPQLHLSSSQLTQDLQQGKYIVQIAKEQGISKEKVRDILIQSTDTVITQELSAGHINQHQSDVLRDRVQKHPFVVSHTLHLVETGK